MKSLKFMFEYIKILIIFLYFFIRSEANVYGSIDSLIINNVTIYKFVAFNLEDQNRACVILQLHARLSLNYTKINKTKEMLVDHTSLLSGNCTGVHRELILNIGIIQLRLLWEREPDPYEFGEIGWSSVGAPANTTSGTYALSRINVSLPSSMLGQKSKDHLVHLINDDYERFKTRSGDHYVCESKVVYQLHLLNNSIIPEAEHIRVTLEMEHFKMQAFSDVNVTDFTGTGQMCHQDLPSDSGVSIGIGVAVAVLVFAVLAFLAIGRLKEKDQQYQELDAGRWVSTRT